MLQRYIILFFWGYICVCICSVAIAQIPFPTKRLTVENGLSQNSVQDFLQDNRGFMWFATSDGLNRYDGYSFIVFRHNERDSTSLAHNWTAALLEDHEGMLWVGTAEGVSVWNPKTSRFTTYRHNPANPHSIGSGGVYSILEDKKQRIWIATLQSGLLRFDRSTRHFTSFTQYSSTEQGLRSNEVYGICEDAKGRLWVGTGYGLHLFNPETGRFKHIPLMGTHSAKEPIRRLFADKDGNLWLGSANAGIFLFNPDTESILRHWQKGKNPDELASNYINYFYESRDGRFWIATQEGGLQTLDKTTGKFTSFLPGKDDEADAGTHTIIAVKEDRSGMMWISTNSGGMRSYSPFYTRFTSFRNAPSNPQSLSHNDVLCFHEDRFGALWIGTYGGGLNRFDPKNHTFQVFHHNPKDASTLGYDYIRAVFEDSYGTLWIGTFGGGLCKAERDKNGAVKHFVTYRHSTKDSTSLNNNHIWRISEDSAGNIWLATNNGSLNKLDRNDLKQGIVRFGHWKIRSDRRGELQTVFHDRKGNTWVGTWGEGLYRFDDATKHFSPTIQHELGDTMSVAARNVVSIYEDRTGALWYGTYGGGIYRWDRTKQNSSPEALMRLSDEHGLPNSVVYGILEDSTGRLWISTNKGIAAITCHDTVHRASPASYRIRSFEVSDGLQSNEFNRGSYARLRSGAMVFGGVNGMTMFHPALIRDNPHPPEVVLTDFRKFNQPVLLDSSISAMSTLNLSYRDEFFSFDFAGLDYVNPAKHEYAYQLEGFDKTWIQAGSQRSVNYTNLDAGEYTFRVKAANGDGVWSPKAASIRVVIAPPFWKTWWFRVPSGVFICLLVLGVYRRRVRAFEKRNRELQHLVEERTVEIRRQMALLDEQAQEIQKANVAMMQKNQALEESNTKFAEADSFKTRILSIAAHDLKTPLVSISGFSDMMLMELELNSPYLPMVQAISNSSERMLNLIVNILDSSAIEMGKMQLQTDILDFAYVCASAAEAHQYSAEKKSQTLHFDTESQCLVRGDQKRLFQVADNLISNALKYSPSGASIYISVKKNQESSQFAVKDQGPGLTDDDKEKLFGFFQRLSARPTGKESSSGVGLAIVKQIVELHGGRVWAESEYGHGSTFIVEIPLADTVQPASAERRTLDE